MTAADKAPSPTSEPAAAKPAPAKKAQLPETTEGMPWPSSHEIKKESNPFTDRDWRMWLYAWSGLVVRFAIILGAIFSIYQYMANAEERRMTRTFELLAEWEKPEYQESQVALRKRLSELNAQYASLLQANPSPTELGVYMDRIGLAAMSDKGGSMPLPEFKVHFDRIVSFLNRVATCVQGGQCSETVTNDYFRDFAVSFWNYFEKYTRQMRAAGSTTFSMSLEEFVTGERPETAPAPLQPLKK